MGHSPVDIEGWWLMFLVIEAGLTVLALVLALTVPNLGSTRVKVLDHRPPASYGGT